MSTENNKEFKTAIPEIDAWISLGYNLKESIRLAELSKHNDHIQAITAEESSRVLKESMKEYDIVPDEGLKTIVDKLSSIDEQSNTMTGESLKELLERFKPIRVK